jgi:hypothetical protein
MMDMKPVSSSNIHSVGYDADKREMRVRFHHGKTYAYSNVSEDTHKALISAKSVGSHFASHVKGKHLYREI